MEYFRGWGPVRRPNTLLSANTTRIRVSWARKEGLYIHQDHALPSEYHEVTATDR